MKNPLRILLFLSIFNSFPSFTQTNQTQTQNEKFSADIDLLVEELQFMYDTDQALREYTLYKTYNKAVTDSIENLPSKDVREYIVAKGFKSDSLAKRVNQKYLLPIDELNTERFIELPKFTVFLQKAEFKKHIKTSWTKSSIRTS